MRNDTGLLQKNDGRINKARKKLGPTQTRTPDPSIDITARYKDHRHQQPYRQRRTNYIPSTTNYPLTATNYTQPTILQPPDIHAHRSYWLLRKHWKQRVKTADHDHKNGCKRTCQTLQLCYVNINVLAEETLDSSDMTKDMRNPDLICLTETHLSKKQILPEKKNYNWNDNTENNNKFCSRNIGPSINTKEPITRTYMENVVNEDGIITIKRI